MVVIFSIIHVFYNNFKIADTIYVFTFRQKYIGLEKKTAGELFFFLIIPTFFVIITVIQLKYFHKDFLSISDIKTRYDALECAYFIHV